MTRRLADQGKLGKRLEGKLRRLEMAAGLRAEGDASQSDLPPSERVNRILASGAIPDPRAPRPPKGRTVAAHFRGGEDD